ncbi:MULTISPECIES: hypothetical protein [Myroides]|uniref:hypothetical protein n=1 Tax=Myroides TaxID=76831 RepID=UPI001327A7EE|nr:MULTISPECIES: hypothetical protein [Myroides]MVX35542.1 hypothetical protein [Myroides sp. LoEW2-1]UVD79730.1 hypothetical protein NWE55_00095 [Myroides albus]
MQELDLLKKHWNQQKDFPKISKEEIQKMIHKKSSSIVMWIFVISIIEFIVLNLLSYLYSFKEQNEIELKGKPLYFLVDYIDYISGLTSIVFIVLFFFNYRKISVATSTKQLIAQILKTKKTVNYYIYTNLIIIGLVIILATINYIPWTNSNINFKQSIVFLALMAVFSALFILLTWGYYKVIYGLLIKKLMKNFKELEKIDSDN